MTTEAMLAQVAAIICETTCGLTSECKSREAAKALFDKGYLRTDAPAPADTAMREALELADGTIEALDVQLRSWGKQTPINVDFVRGSIRATLSKSALEGN